MSTASAFSSTTAPSFHLIPQWAGLPTPSVCSDLYACPAMSWRGSPAYSLLFGLLSVRIWRVDCLLMQITSPSVQFLSDRYLRPSANEWSSELYTSQMVSRCYVPLLYANPVAITPSGVVRTHPASQFPVSSF